MKRRDQWFSLTVDELEKEIEIRNNLLNQMVGTLYSGIVEEECYDLRVMVADIKATVREAALLGENHG
jgi:hypothetical protein